MSKPRYYVGVAVGTRDVFQSESIPTESTHGDKYAACIGPFNTKRGAVFMRDHGQGNPHLQCVGDAERIAAMA